MKIMLLLTTLLFSQAHASTCESLIEAFHEEAPTASRVVSRIPQMNALEKQAVRAAQHGGIIETYEFQGKTIVLISYMSQGNEVITYLLAEGHGVRSLGTAIGGDLVCAQ